MAIQPFGNRVLVKQVTKQTFATDAGILLGEERAPQSHRMEVLAIGPEVTKLKIGDICLVAAFSSVEAREKPQDQTVMCSEDDVLGVITNDSVKS